EAETAISCFKNIFKNKVKPGTEIKINEKSNIRDPVKDNAPPLSRIEIRKVIQSNSKPLLVDLYVSAKQEYLSSTVILKQGDDLRIDAAVLQLFRLFNKIWREAGLEYNDCPVRAHYYKCVAMVFSIPFYFKKKKKQKKPLYIT
ncbi:PI3K-CA alpha, partial [Reticulomyxa filosa]